MARLCRRPLRTSPSQRGHLREAHAGEDNDHAQPFDDTEGLAKHDHGDEKAGGELGGGHDGGEVGGQVRRAQAEEQHRAHEAEEARYGGEGQDALEDDAGDEVVRTHDERHEAGAQAHDDAALLVGALYLGLAGERDEQRAGNGRAEGAGKRRGIVAGKPRLVDAACEHSAEHDDRGRGDFEGLGRPPRYDGLPDESHPGELEQQRERYGCGEHAHGVAVQDRSGAG